MTESAAAVAGDNRRPKRPKKKKNNRFLRNAKGFAKQGIYGRGTVIADDDYQYFINILDTMKTGFEDVEEKVNMANNVFEQTRDQEIHFASNQIVCKALETLVGFVDATHLERYFNVFADNFRPMCSDRFASHVLQKMVEIAFLRGIGKSGRKSMKADDDENGDDDHDKGDDKEEDKSSIPPNKRLKIDVLNEEHYNLESDFTDKHRSNCRTFVERISKFLLNNLEDFVWDSCANHIMRTCILSLVGVHMPKVAFEKRATDITAKTLNHYNVPADWIEIMKEYPQRLEMWPQFSDFPYSEHSSALLATICIALKVVDKSMLKHFGKKILMSSLLDVADDEQKKDKIIEIIDNDEDSSEKGAQMPTEEHTEATDGNSTNTPKLPSVFEHKSAVVLLETLLTLAGRKLITQLYAMLFIGRIAVLAQQSQTNFAVQKLLQHIKNKEDFENIFNELSEHVEELLKIGHTGVISALTDACLRLGTKQAQMIVTLQRALHVAGDKEKAKFLFPCLIKLKPYEIIRDDQSNFVHLHGSLIVQHLLQYNKPIFVVNCILETAADVLLAILNTPNGSHIADAFMQSKYIGEKSREKFIRHMEGFHIDLAITKFGSRVIDCLYDGAQEAQKARIVKELADKVNMLKGSPFGRLLYNKLRVETFRLSATQWRACIQQQQQKQQQSKQPKHQTKEQKAAELFKDIIS